MIPDVAVRAEKRKTLNRNSPTAPMHRQVGCTKVEGSLVVREDMRGSSSHSVDSGLVRRADGAMVLPGTGMSGHFCRISGQLNCDTVDMLFAPFAADS